MGKRKSKETGLLYDAKRDGELAVDEVILIGKNGTHKKIIRRNKKTAGSPQTTRSNVPRGSVVNEKAP